MFMHQPPLQEMVYLSRSRNKKVKVRLFFSVSAVGFLLDFLKRNLLDFFYVVVFLSLPPQRVLSYPANRGKAI